MTVPRTRSIFAKLILTYCLALAIVALGIGAIRLLSDASTEVDIPVRYLQAAAAMLVKEIGSPPDAEVARRIAEEADVGIAIIGPGLEWASRGSLLEEARNIAEKAVDDRSYTLVKDKHSIVARDGEYRYLFSIPSSDHSTVAIVTLVMTLAVLLALAVNYALVRRLLEPLHAMYKVAREFGLREWKVRVKPTGRDEFSALGEAMDAMADRIEDYVTAMHDLISAISHEVRSPLTRMKVVLESIGDRRVKKSLNKEIDTLVALTSALLEQKRLTTQQDVLDTEEAALHAWITEACEPFRRAGAPVLVVLDGEDRVARIDRARMDMAVRNLVDNALVHAPGSPVAVALRTDGSGEGGFVLEVRDEGPGMPERYLKRIGEPFLLVDRSRSGPRSGGGFGLGLSIVRAVAEAHGAAFAARNLAPGGFSVTLSFTGTTGAGARGQRGAGA